MRAQTVRALATLPLAVALVAGSAQAQLPAGDGPVDAGIPLELSNSGEDLDDPAPSAGLSAEARQELRDAGLDRHLGAFTPQESQDLGNGWVQHVFDPEGGLGPVCISGTPYVVYTRAASAERLLVFAAGGGACWQDFYLCNLYAEDQDPFSGTGIWDLDAPDNPFADHSIVYLPYCDGSFFSGDRAVWDPDFPHGLIRHHRGLRNQSAALDLAAALFPDAQEVTLAGASAGGVGVATFTPFLTRFVYGDEVDLSVINDAGPVAQNPEQAAVLDARDADWRTTDLFPASCTECTARDPAIPLIHWRLEHDATVRDAFYSTDADSLVRFFLGIASPTAYRELLLAEHGALHAAHPLRYKRFIPSGDESHAALQEPRFYTQEVDGVELDFWTQFFTLVPDLTADMVEEYEPAN